MIMQWCCSCYMPRCDGQTKTGEWWKWDAQEWMGRTIYGLIKKKIIVKSQNLQKNTGNIT